MRVDELREKYLAFFESRGHTRVRSASLIPDRDPTLLFTGAGMNPFKERFLGFGLEEYTRAASCQKCLRTGDIERVGRTSGHHTFFEMLGNFSFGDYFKEEAIAWAWEFLTGELGIPAEKIEVSVYKEDEEAYRAWSEKVGVSTNRIHRFGPKENFWPANAPADGPDGPCGSCSEIFFDRGPEHACGEPRCGPSCDCDRYVEIWNLVFTQYDRQPDGELRPLPRKNIDTGMGLERMAQVLQGVETTFDTDVLKSVVERVAETAGKPYEPRGETGARMRRIADHVRAVVFCVADGVIPSNEGRGYVERRLIRRAIRDGLDLGVEEDLLGRIIPVVIERMQGAYPELAERRETILSVLTGEETRFRTTLAQGIDLLRKVIGEMKERGETVLDGERAFQLYDTFGFPLEMAENLLTEEGMEVDTAGFEKEMELQRSRGRMAGGGTGRIFVTGPWSKLRTISQATKFIGYTKLAGKGKVLAILGRQGEKEETFLAEAPEGAEVSVLLDKTPFYGESGGQIGDAGRLRWKGGEVRIDDTQHVDTLLVHRGTVTRGTLTAGQDVQAEVDVRRRQAIMRHHTATHLLHAAIRDVVGNHAEQAGSLVAADRLRFDITHTKPLTEEEIRDVESLVTDQVLADVKVQTREMPFKEARARGAMALFDEKYGEKVRVVEVGEFSLELCGGTHVKACGEIGPFLLEKQESVGAGVRRLEVVCGYAALRRMEENRSVLRTLQEAVGGGGEDLADRIRAVIDENRRLQKEMGRSRKDAAAASVEDLIAAAEAAGGVKIVRGMLPGAGPDELKAAADRIRQAAPDFVAALGGDAGGRAHLVVAVGRGQAERGMDAAAVVRKAAERLGGGGGGQSHLAQAGGADLGTLAGAIEEATAALREGLGRGASG